MLFTTLVTCLSLILYLILGINVGRARAKFKIAAPAIAGHPNFERIFRVQQNTQEQLLLFLPSLWLFSNYISSFWGGILGIVWIFGRIFYARCYYQEAGKRIIGFVISLLVSLTLLFGVTGYILFKLAELI